jgi:predicted  nucleic acid-binding Zn-ribbon protein
VTEELRILYEVQQADSEIARRREALDALESGEDLERTMGETQSEIGTLEEQHRATEKDYLDCELELKTLEEKREKFQGQLYSGAISNPRQLSDLQEEVQMLTREIAKVEDRMLELMESLETERSEIDAREERVKEAGAELEEVRAKYETTGSRLRSEIQELAAKRAEQAARVNAQLLKRYEQIRARQGNLGLVKITDDTCPGCRIGLPSETVKALKAGRANLTCDNCGRLLLWGQSED